VASSVAGVIEPALQAAETARSAGRPTNDLPAYDLYLRAYAMYLSSEARVPEALRLLEQAIARDPRYPLAAGFDKGGAERVTRRYRRDDLPEDQCWAARAGLVSGLPLMHRTFYIRLARGEYVCHARTSCYRADPSSAVPGQSGRFAPDSPLEGDGFEPSVPPKKSCGLCPTVERDHQLRKASVAQHGRGRGGKEQRRRLGGTSPTPLPGSARHAQPGSVLYTLWVNMMSVARITALDLASLPRGAALVGKGRIAGDHE
jgi:hypothetical protein